MNRITPFGVARSQHRSVMAICCSASMPPEAAARVQRLVRWIKSRRKDLLATDGEVSPSLLATATSKKPSYWSDVLRHERSSKSFGDKTARQAEEALQMPALYLEGIGWPFDGVAQDRFDRLTERQKGRVEQAMLDAIAAIEAEQQARLGEAGKATAPRHSAQSKAA